MNQAIDFYIIVPIYNVELYLQECLDSISNQSYTKFQAILINDGSTDKSGEIARIYAKRDTRFITLEQENQGVSMARNAGLDYIKHNFYNNDNGGGGELNVKNKASKKLKSFVVFIDSDDFVESGALQTIAEILQKNELLDFICFNSLYFNNILENSYFLKIDEGIFSSLEVLKLCPHIRFFGPYLFVYSCDFLFEHNFRFEKGIIYEDMLFCQYAFSKSFKFYISNYAFYHYRVREGSLMNSVKDNINNVKRSAISYFTLANKLYQYANENENMKECFLHWSIFYAKEILRDLQIIGYDKSLPFGKKDLKQFLVFFRPKHRFCYHFPRIYGFPKRVRLFFTKFF